MVVKTIYRKKAGECDVRNRPPASNAAHTETNSLPKCEPVQEVRIDMMGGYGLNGWLGDGLQLDCEAQALDWDAIAGVAEEADLVCCGEYARVKDV